ncbi:MAG: protein translocase subunit SecD [Acidimicrobiales bacterium]
MPTSQRVSAIIVVAVALLGAIYTVASGNQPLLGLDLQGGVSVVLEPTGASEGQPGREVTDEALDLTVELLRARIDQIGVAEPEISRQGNNIVVGLPGLVEEQEQALDRLRQTAELRFRPVISDLPPAGLTVEDLAPGTEDQPAPGAEPEGSTSTGAESSNADTGDSGAATGDEESLVATGGRFGPVFQAQTTTTGTTGTTETTETVATTDSTEVTGTTEAGADETTTTDGADGATPDGAQPELINENPLSGCTIEGNTADDDDTLDAYVVLSDGDGLRYCLGPALIDDRPLTGDMVETASVGLNPGIGWQVNPTFNSGENGIDRFNEIAALCFVRDPAVCPTGRLAVVLDHEVISAPQINAGSFSRDQIVISGSSQNPFEEDEARRLAEALRFGALPLELVAQETRTVSATIGQDVLRSGVISGLIGLVLVALYLLAYYRLAALVAISGLLLSGLLLWTIIAWFGESFGLALSLAGVVGLIVSIGVSADSNIVYFENVKDSYRSGRRIPTAVERAYESSISTIIKADVVSLIAAVLLYLLTVGAVRGFAFYLGLATILDLIISWLFMRPALAWLARRTAVVENPTLLGLPATGGAK